MSVQMRGFKELAEELEEIPRKLRPEVFKVISETASDIQRDAQRRVPVDTGDLRDSIKVKESEKDLNAVIWPDYPKSGRTIKKGSKKSQSAAKVYYAYAVEYGTKTHREQPFLNPARDAAEEKFVERIDRILGGVVDGTL